MFTKNSNGDAGKIKKFSKGTKYIMDGEEWTVKESFIDDNTEMRRIVSFGGRENVVLTLLELEAFAKECPDFKMVYDPNFPSKITEAETGENESE